MFKGGDPYSILNKDPNRGKIEPKNFVKVHRYWPGKVPEFALDQENSSENEENYLEDAKQGKYKSYTEANKQAKTNKRKTTNKPTKEKGDKQIIIIEEAKERKIERGVILLDSTNADGNKDSDNKEVDSVETINKYTPEEERKRAKLKLLAMEREETEDPDAFADLSDDDLEFNNSEEEDSGSSYLEEDDEDRGQLLKPVFVRKEDRKTVKDKEKKEIEIAIEMEEENRRREQRRIETKMMIIRSIKQDEEQKEKSNNSDSDRDLPSDDDAVNDGYEYEQWKVRELKRIKKYKEGRIQKDKERAEIERRRGLNDLEREEEDKRLGTDESEKPHFQQYKFMQKYYHRGAYTQHLSEKLLNRDFNAPVGEDRMDKSTLPNTKQKRRGDYGTKGQTKWTHLTAEDTTNFDPSFKVPEGISKRLTMKGAGYKGATNLKTPGLRNRK